MDIKWDEGHILLGVYYIFPGMPVEDFKRMLEHVQQVSYNGDIYVVGHFNLPKVQWKEMNCSECTYAVAAKAQVLGEFINLLRLLQVNEICNANGVLLDLIFFFQIFLIIIHIVLEHYVYRKKFIILLCV